jgi:hypothetical protein
MSEKEGTYCVTGWGPVSEGRDARRHVPQDRLESTVAQLFEKGARRVTVTAEGQESKSPDS